MRLYDGESGYWRRDFIDRYDESPQLLEAYYVAISYVIDPLTFQEK